jgi:hypothetical protein
MRSRPVFIRSLAVAVRPRSRVHHHQPDTIGIVEARDGHPLKDGHVRVAWNAIRFRMFLGGGANAGPR